MAGSDTDQPQHADPPEIQPLTLFEILVRENADSLTAFLRASVGDASAADDLFQETMLVAWRRISEYDHTRPFGAWLRGIGKRLVLAHYRTLGREVAFSDERILEYIDQRMSQIDRQPGDSFDEKIAALKECVKRLEPHYKQAIEWHYRECKTTEWIAEHMATTKDAIQKRLQRARLQLAECLEQKHVLSATGSS